MYEQYIPFFIFSHESHFKDYKQDSKQLEYLKSEYRHLMTSLEEFVTANIINEYTRYTLIDMSKKILEHIASKHKNVRKGVKTIMGGEVLEYEAKTIKREGIKEGRLHMLFDLVRDNLLPLQETISRAGLTEEAFLKKMNEYKV